jgi:muramoyltetrapeptide carboxypeptidase
MDLGNSTPRRPPAWREGMKIGVLSAASGSAYRLPVRLARAQARISRCLGGTVLPLEPADKSLGYRAMSPERVADLLHEMFIRPDVGLIISAIGGFNSNAVLRLLDWELLRKHPTHICGYSDTSALLLAIHARAGQVVLHGPALLPQWGDPKGPFPESIASLSQCLLGASQEWSLGYPGYWVDPRLDWSEGQDCLSFHDKPRCAGPWRVLRRGVARGRLIGGNIETINMLIGTPFQPCFDDAIVFLEATGAEAYLPRFHRALTHLRDADMFTRARGLLIGRSPDMQSIDGFALDDVVGEVFGDAEMPVVVDVDIGHTEPLVTLPIGLLATIYAVEESPKIEIYS